MSDMSWLLIENQSLKSFMDETYIKLFYIEREQLKNRDTFISPKEKLENIFQSKIEINNLKFSD